MEIKPRGAGGSRRDSYGLTFSLLKVFKENQCKPEDLGKKILLWKGKENGLFGVPSKEKNLSVRGAQRILLLMTRVSW